MQRAPFVVASDGARRVDMSNASSYAQRSNATSATIFVAVILLHAHQQGGCVV